MTPDCVYIKDRSRRASIVRRHRSQRVYLRFIGAMFICMAPVATLATMDELTILQLAAGVLCGALILGIGIGCWSVASRIMPYRRQSARLHTRL